MPRDQENERLIKRFEELRRLFGKFREGNLTTLEALNGYLFLYLDCSFFVIPIFALLFIDIEVDSTKDERVYFVAAFFFVVFFIKWMILFSRTLPKHPTVLIRIYRMLGSVIFAAVSSYMCIGYFIFWNVISGSNERILVSGPVIDMKVGTGGRFMSKPYFVSIYYEGRNIKLTVPPQEYAALKEGQTYYREMKLGGLGYYYNWGSSWWK